MEQLHKAQNRRFDSQDGRSFGSGNFSAARYKEQLLASADIESCPKVPLPPVEKGQGYLFISYAHKNYRQVYGILADLYKAGVRFWYDEGLSAGLNWETEVEIYIRNPDCDGVIFFMSEELFESESSEKEINITLQPESMKKYFAVNLTGQDPSTLLYSAMNRQTKPMDMEHVQTLSGAFSNKTTYIKYSREDHLEILLREIQKQFDVMGTGTKMGKIKRRAERIRKAVSNRPWISTVAVLALAGLLLLPSPEAERPVPTEETEVITAADRAWQNNVLMADKNDVVAGLGGYRSSVEIVPVFGSGILRSEIRTVKFLSSTETAPGASWDVSAAQDGSVLAWVEQAGHGMYTLYIAADGGVNGKLSCKDLFCGYANLTEVNFNDSFHTEESVDMSRMFYGCRNLQTLDLTGIQTTNAENFSEMFSGCATLETLDVSGFVTSKVADMSGMFYKCESLNALDITTFATYNVKNVSYMFYGCGAEVNLSQFNTSKVLYATAFMEDGAQVEGIAWEEWLGVYDWEPRTTPQRIMTHTWDTGSMILRVMDNSRIRIELMENFLQETLEEKSMWLHLYHDAGINNGYEIQIKNNNGVLSSNCSYLLWGSAANSHYPEDFTWWVEENVLVMELTANSKDPAGMYTLQAVQIEQEDSSSAVYSGKISNAVSSVQFQHFKGPDQEAGGEVTEKAIVVGLDFEGEPVWTHLTSIKYEHAQSDKLSEVGYINNRYYYMDEGDMVILDAETGEIQRVVSNIGSAFTDVDVSADGKIYLCYYWDPWFTAMLPDGTVLHQIREQGNMHFWAGDILVKGDKAYISFGSDPNGTVLEVDLADYSYRFA